MCRLSIAQIRNFTSKINKHERFGAAIKRHELLNIVLVIYPTIYSPDRVFAISKLTDYEILDSVGYQFDIYLTVCKLVVKFYEMLRPK